MTLPRIFVVVTLLLFGAIGFLAINKKKSKNPETTSCSVATSSAKTNAKAFEGQPIEIDLKQLAPQAKSMKQEVVVSQPQPLKRLPADSSLPEVDNTHLLFQKNSPFSFVETLRYKSRVAWKQGKAAWLVDYAMHYQTPVDFIARSINGRPEYTVPQISEGQTFNVLKRESDVSFSLVLDLGRCRMWLYAVDPETESATLIKTYHVGLGRLDQTKTSGSLTPLGTYKIGGRVAVFKPKMMGMHRMKKVELIRVFGTRWIPFESEIGNCTEPAKGYGIHGIPWAFNEAKNVLHDDDSSIGGYESDGCVRLKTKDMEELYSIISTRGAMIQIVRDVQQAQLPPNLKMGEKTTMAARS
ncbi:MAG TPA: L,D-transpeptidase [Chlamydiales bacterium]|nr:L,D-transpeptidase [Chlamydiales bacterium]